MDGFLSDSTRDAIAVIGLLLGIVQLLMAVLSGSSSKPTRRRSVQSHRSGVLGRFRSELRKPGRIFEKEGEFRNAAVIFVGLGIVVFGSFYILTLSGGEVMSSFQAIIFIAAMISLNVQVFLTFAFMMAAQQILEDYSEAFERLFNTHDGVFAYGTISLVVLFVSFLLLRQLDSYNIWFVGAFKAYLWAALVWSCITLIPTTIYGVIETTKMILKKG